MHVPPPPAQVERRGFPAWAWVVVALITLLFCSGVYIAALEGAKAMKSFDQTISDLGEEDEGWPEYAANYAVICIDEFHRDLGRYPTKQEGFNALLESPPNESRWDGPYADDWFEDEWGQKLVYEPLPTGYRVISLGADGREGGSGDNADLILERRNAN